MQQKSIFQTMLFATLFIVNTFYPSVSYASFNTNLYYGLSNNESVKELQMFLADQGIYYGPINGNYFQITKKAVIEFQNQEGIMPARGYFGLKTRLIANVAINNPDTGTTTSIITSTTFAENKGITSSTTESTDNSSVQEIIASSTNLTDLSNKYSDLSMKYDTLTAQIESQSSALGNLTDEIAQLQMAFSTFQNMLALSSTPLVTVYNPNQPQSVSTSTTLHSIVPSTTQVKIHSVPIITSSSTTLPYNSIKK